MENFNFYQPTRVHFGAGRLNEVGAVVGKYGKKCMLVTTTNEEAVLRPLYDRVKGLMAGAGIEVVHFDKVVPNPTIVGIEEAIGIVHAENIQVVLAVGGGSSIDTAKSICLFHGAGKVDWGEVFSSYTDPFAEYESPSPVNLPLIAVPTTAGTGSELTQAMVISDQEHNDKECIFHDKAFAKEAIIDPELMRTLPPRMTAITGFDAFTHAFESYLRDCASPYTKMIGLRAMGLIIDTLPRLVNDTGNMELRERMAQAAMFSGISLGNAAACLPHPISEIVGGVAPRLAHGQCLATLYPQFLRWQSTQSVEKCADVARLFDPALAAADDAAAAARLSELMVDFLQRVGLYKSFEELGLTEDELKEAEACPVFNFLPFAPKDVMVGILHDSFRF
ncbi:iron-containing alcohol dehydrogenase [Pseudoflavonifractor phocaeensis]|uniref:iron-containing alcohol dehydrogenase n=1 Tax=Pseudoflavonifractor phocaeensis TaxID=1870988 RepID=UPI0021098BDA|nr:iron-containing alcohol dehydrogenase [Pseudoflavonifractor phocaeensis]MCQ4863977.1 iron-containing alcohol dehydrogenase [Pseudoflavonifractor phocaeensis]